MENIFENTKLKFKNLKSKQNKNRYDKLPSRGQLNKLKVEKMCQMCHTEHVNF